MTKAPLKIWHSMDRRGKLIPTQDAHVKPCAPVENAYVEYIRADAARSERETLEAQNRDLLEWADRLSEALGVQIAQNGSRNAAALNKEFRGFRAAIAKAKGEA